MMAPRRGNRKRRRWCWYCGAWLTKATATKDHKVPVSRGGGGGANKVDACLSCNNRKDNLSVNQFRQVFFGTSEGKFWGEHEISV
jgi:hypothetical protein